MGKSRGSQRTKGNTRPSSSGHSAQLLSSTGTSGFVGFSKVTQHVAQNSDSNVDGTFAMVMKKMLKRDTTTKLKAIQEFRDLCDEKEKEEVLEIIAFWPRLYNKLALEFDRRIREATQEANGKLVTKVKRDIAPYLRNIMGVWLLSQNDLFPSAASTAQVAFCLTFPKEKQSEALMFCKDEILAYFKDNLLEQTQQSLSEPNTSAEEVEQKYTLVISGTLCGLKQFVSTISSDARAKVVEDIGALIATGKFWKFSKSENSQIRVSWYNLISSLCHELPQVFQSYENKLGCAVLGCLSESDPVVAPAIWEAALYYIADFENCWDNLNVDKVVMPELLKLLKEGGWGNAQVLYPCLLPFLSKFPLDVIKQRANFFQLFFSHIIKSLFLESVKASSSECNAIVAAYVECMSYVCFQLGSKDEWSSVVESLVSDQLISLIERSFTPEAVHLRNSKFYPLLGSFFEMLENHSTKEDTKEMFMQLQVLIWEQVFSLCEKLLADDYPPQSLDLSFIAPFFHCMYKPLSFLDKKKAKVKFSDESSQCELVSSKASLSADALPLPSQRGQLFRCTVKMSKLLYSKLQSDLQAHYLKMFAALLSSCHCPEMFRELLLASDISNADLEPPLTFFEEIIDSWVLYGDKEAVFEGLVDIIFYICSDVGKNSALKILNYCCQVDKPEFVKQLLLRGMLTYGEDTLFCNWLKSCEAGKTVLNLFNLAIRVNSPDQCQKRKTTNLQSYFLALQYCLFHSTGKEFVIDKKYYEEILSIINNRDIYSPTKPLKSTDHEMLEFICYTAENIFKNYEECWTLAVANDLAKKFLLLSLNICHEASIKNLHAKLINLCKLSFQKLSIIQYNLEPKEQFIFSAADCFHKLLIQPLNNEICTWIVEYLWMMMCEVRNTYLSVEESEDDVELKLCSIFEKVFPSDNQWDQMRSNLKLSLLPAYLEKKLFGPHFVEKHFAVEPISAPNFSAAVKNVSDLILECVNCEELAEMKSVLIKIATKQLFHLLWAFSYYVQNGPLNKKSTDLDEDEDEMSKLQKKCFKILSFLPKDNAVAFLKQLSEMSNSCSNEWILPFENAIEMIKIQHSLDMSTLYKLYMELSDDENSGKQFMSQMVIHFLPTSLKTDILLHFASPFCQSLGHGSVNLLALAKICCCVQDSTLLSDIEVQDALINILSEAISFISGEKLKDSKHEHLLEISTQVYCLAGQVMKNCPEILVRLWDSYLDFVCFSIQICAEQKEFICSESKELIHAYHCSTMVCNLLCLTTGNNQFSERSISLRKPSFMSSVCRNLIDIFLDISNLSKAMKTFPQQLASFIAAVIMSFEFISSNLMFDAMLLMDCATECHQQNTVESALNEKLLPLLTSSVFPIQLGAQLILTKILPLLPPFLNIDDPVQDEEERKFKKMQSLVKVMESTTRIVESMLSDFKIGQSCYVLPGTDSYIYTLGFLFSWKAMLEYFAASTAKERSMYSVYLEADNLLTTFFSCLFRLLPENPTLCATVRANKDKDTLKSIFLEPAMPLSLEHPTAEFVQRMACNTYCNALARMPAAIRSWGHSLDKKAYEVVYKFTSKYVSSLVAAREIESLQECKEVLTQLRTKNMKIQACPSSREVIAMYTIDATTIELIIQLPVDFPFRPINIEKHGNVKLGQLKWRHWMMQLTAFLTYQNGSILDGLLLWKKNLDKTFEGVEECLICFFILHITSLELPQKSCPTCKKKFHAWCIHKWFVTSNSTACPLCRNYW